MGDFLLRALNGIRKVAAGLPPFGESVWPGVRNDLFVAHESIYVFAAQFAEGHRVLDAGCGTGYGALLLAQNASCVIAVDLDRRNIAFAKKRFAAPNIEFQVADLQSLVFPDRSFSFVIASNSLEHVSKPDVFLRTLSRILRPGGRALVVVPPIYTDHDESMHEDIHYHRSNLRMEEWLGLFEASGFRTSTYRHWADPLPDFFSRRSSILTPANFTFTPIAVDSLLKEPSISGIFLLDQDLRRAAR